MLLGLLKCYSGLSGAILTQIYMVVYGDHSTSSILLATWLPTIISLLVMYTVGEKGVKIRQPNVVKVFYHFLYLSAILAAFLMAIILSKEYVVFSRPANVRSVVTLCIILFLHVVVVFRQEVFSWKQMKEPSTTIVVESPQTVKQEQNYAADQVEDNTFIVGQEQNSS